MFLSFFRSLISFSNAYLSAVHCQFALCREGLCVLTQLCVDRQAVLTLFDALSLSWQCADCSSAVLTVKLRRRAGWSELHSLAAGAPCVQTPHLTHARSVTLTHAESSRRCSPGWTATFNNSSDLVRRVPNERKITVWCPQVLFLSK